MNAEFIAALEQIEREKGVQKEILFEALEMALLNAYKKNFGTTHNVRVEMDKENGDVKVLASRTVVDKDPEEVYDGEIGLQEAREHYNPKYQEGDVIENEITPKNFGRIAAQAARQMVIQKIKEAERDIIYEEFLNRESEIINGEIIRVGRGNVYINITIISSKDITISAEATLTASEQIAFEEYVPGSRIKVYIVEIKRNNNVPQIIVSRSHPGLVKRLFESEVPEIFDGIVQIKSVSREAGSRTKMAVLSLDENVDPIGACVGPKGQRVKNIVEELQGEKIDIIQYSEDPVEYISASLSPSKVVSVDVNEEDKSARVVVPDDKLSLAIGKEGQNARLAAKLTNWKIDIKSESQMKKLMEEFDQKLEEESAQELEQELDQEPIGEEIDGIDEKNGELPEE